LKEEVGFEELLGGELTHGVLVSGVVRNNKQLAESQRKQKSKERSVGIPGIVAFCKTFWNSLFGMQPEQR
jgi:hypothetical protein